MWHAFLNAPVILVVDIKGMSRSVLALIKGYLDFDTTISIAGVILNRVGSQRHRQMIEGSVSLPVLGWIPKREDITIESRHLGLKMAHETGSMTEFGSVIEEFCDLDALIACSKKTNGLASQTMVKESRIEKQVHASVGVALDDAFCFYYQDNLDRLRALGAGLVFFSPLVDPLPDVDALYFGGGYPELHLPALESSRCTQGIRSAVEKGMPVYAECGGLLYLTREMMTERSYRLCDVLPARAEMTTRVQALGYIKGESILNSSFLLPHVSLSGHEFHYSHVHPDRDAHYAFHLSRGKGIDSGKDGLTVCNAIGTFTHAYFSDAFVKQFIESAIHFSKE